MLIFIEFMIVIISFLVSEMIRTDGRNKELYDFFIVPLGETLGNVALQLSVIVGINLLMLAFLIIIIVAEGFFLKDKEEVDHVN